ncbi:phage tail protein I [Desulfovibrio piger]|nr:phage tail protein I [Desulfovibrio piger]
MDRDELLQPSLQGDSRMENLARLIARLSALPVSVPIVNLFDRVDASALASLAEQFHVMGDEGWNLAGTEAARRALLKRAIELHRHKGTPWAVRTALETALPTEATIKEWFAYDGDPFFFRVRLDVSELGLDESGMTSAARLIFDYKNVRSWLECLETFTRRPLPIAVATAGVMRTLNRVRLWFPPRPVPPARVHVAVAGIMRSRSRLCPFTPPRPVPAARGRVALALLTMTRSRVCPQP